MNQLHLYNTITKQLSPFTPLHPPHVGIYLCGPTVYGPAHMGHARSAITIDITVRYLRHLGYNVCYVRNVTDVGHLTNDADDGEDKVAKQAQKAQLRPMEVAQTYTNSYRKDMGKLNVLPPNIEPHATGHIIEQIELIQTILRNGFAYEANGSVYFDLPAYQRKYPYGELSGRKQEEMLTGTRTLRQTHDKRNIHDFALWKKADKNHLMQWSSPWSKGFPGWHIECTAMSQKYLGKKFDIYAGGMDLLFPHHECSIAQAIASTGTPPASYWLHNNLVMINQQKMSKSANNFITLEACFAGEHPLLTKAYPPMTVRFFMLQAHYRHPMNFSDRALQAASKGYYKLMNGLKTLRKYTQHPCGGSQPDQEVSTQIIEACRQCYDAMNEDFNTAKTIAQLFELRRFIYLIDSNEIPLPKVSQDAWKKLQQTYVLFLEDILGLKEKHTIQSHALIEALLAQYAEAKARKDYTQVDRIRQALKKQHIVIQDSHHGFGWSYHV